MLGGIQPGSDIYNIMLTGQPISIYLGQALLGTNAVMNGSMQVWQRNTTWAAIATNTVTADRWKYRKFVTGAVHTADRSVDTPGSVVGGSWDAGNTGFVYSLKLTCTTADASVGSTDAVILQNVIEGPTHWHKYANQKLTLSFWVKSTITGTYCVALNNNPSQALSFVAEYTVNAADVWEKKIINIPAYTGEWSASDHLQLTFCLMAGSGYQGAANAWTAQSQIYATANQVNACSTAVSNTFLLTGVQLQLGDKATAFYHLDLTMERNQCMRYYEKSFQYATVPAYGVTWTQGNPAIGVQVVAASTMQRLAATAQFMIEKRIAADGSNTIAYNPVTASSAQVYNITDAEDCSSTALQSASTKAVTWQAVTPAGSSAGQLLALHWTTDAEI